MGSDPVENAAKHAPPEDPSTTPDLSHGCDAVIQSTGNPCNEVARWRVIVQGAAAMRLWRCDRHLRKLQDKYGMSGEVLTWELIGSR